MRQNNGNGSDHKLTQREVSPQRAYQLRQRQAGKCIVCGKPTCRNKKTGRRNKSHCEAHAEAHRIRQRLRYQGSKLAA